MLRGTSGFVPWSQIPPMLGVVVVAGGMLALTAVQSGHGILDAIRHELIASYDTQNATLGEGQRPVAAKMVKQLSQRCLGRGGSCSRPAGGTHQQFK